jgi:hypothetical protein
MRPLSTPAVSIFLRFLLVALLFFSFQTRAAFSGASVVFSAPLPSPQSSTAVTTGCPALVDSTASTGNNIDDFTEHTYSVPAGGRGSFAECTVTRTFSQPIQSIQVIIEAGRADDIGYVGSQLVTSVVPACSDIGTVTTAVDVTSQVSVNGSSASFVLRAQENCCCVTGWGQLTQSDRANARFHWIVTLGGGEFAVSFSTFIPANNVAGPPQAICLAQEVPPVRHLFFAGDNRGFSASATSFRTRQTVTVVSEQAVDADGIKDGTTPQNSVGQTRSYASDALDDGTINAADNDGTLNDCHLLHQTGLASTGAMQIMVTRTGAHEVRVRMFGGADNPLVAGSCSIDWDLTLTINTAGSTPQYTLVGTHDGFPAYEVYVNGRSIYTFDPGPAPYSLSVLLRLCGGQDRSLNVAGSLP